LVVEKERERKRKRKRKIDTASSWKGIAETGKKSSISGIDTEIISPCHGEELWSILIIHDCIALCWLCFEFLIIEYVWNNTVHEKPIQALIPKTTMNNAS